MKKLIYNNKNILFILSICFLSIIFNFHYGYRGVFPIDSFLIYDSGYNVLNGNYPFKNYWSITGPLLDYLQAFFFLIFGVNWFSYVLHASILNLSLALLSYFVFKELGLKQSYSFIYSLGISLLAYPSIGVPFIDHHSTIFSILSIYCFILALKRKNNFLLLLIPVFLGLSFLSKQIPAAYIIVFVSLVLIFDFVYNFNKKGLYFTIGGLVLFFLFIFLIFRLSNIPFTNFLTQYIFYPSTIGQDRINNFNINIEDIFNKFKFIYISIFPLFVVIYKIISKKKLIKSEKNDLMIIFLIIGMVNIFIYTQMITKNQILIFFLIPLTTAFSHVFYKKYIKSKEYLIYIVIFLCIISVFKYHMRFNENKKFMELANVNINLAVDAGKIDKMFLGLNWITKYYPNNPTREIKNLVEINEYIKLDTKKKIFITDYQFFSALSKSSFSSPNKWYDSMSIPNSENKYYKQYKKFFIDRLIENEVQEIYTIGSKDYLPVLYIYFKDIINNDCVSSKQVNEMLIIYDISNCDL